jgi:arabinan endo-1,5-alpha-L-arabinosidase
MRTQLFRNAVLTIVFTVVFSMTKCKAQNDPIIVHDPVAIESEGFYYIFNTGRGISTWQSKDLKKWERLNPVFSKSPDWGKAEVPKFDGNIWAPDISFHNGLYYLYYSISSFASNRSCIGIATNKSLNPNSPDYKWTDHGKIIESVPGRDNWNAIDPNLILDESNQPWLVFGSFWGGLKITKLNNDLLSIAQPQEWHTVASRERDQLLDETDPGGGAIEAPFIFRKGNYYYLFLSFDLCCRGANSNYNVRVGRSEKVTGPYIDKEGKPLLQGGGTLIAQGDDQYYGKGHNSVYTFNNIDYMFLHGYEKKTNGAPKLITYILGWDETGWPFIRN